MQIACERVAHHCSFSSPDQPREKMDDSHYESEASASHASLEHMELEIIRESTV